MAHAALTDINLVIPDGQFIGLIGHTGSGKSTLVQHLNGLLKPTDGVIYYNGADINGDGFDKKELRGKVGLVFQYPEHQLFEIDVFTDVCFGPKNLGLDRKEVELRAYAALKQVGLEDEYFYQSPFDLSGGQKRRAAIAGVLAMKPEVLILDEPTAGLDPKERVRFRNMLRDLSGERIVILSTHIVSDIETIADRIIMLKDHEVFCNETPDQVCGWLEGKIFEVPSGCVIPIDHEVLSERQSAQGSMVRFYSEEYCGSAMEVSPNLEDVFLTVYRDER